MKRILALDLGSNTGWARRDGDHIIAGTWELCSKKQLAADRKTGRDRRTDCRIVSLAAQLSAEAHEWQPELVVFEDVRFASTSMVAHLWGSLRAAVWLWAHQCAAEVDCLHVQGLKKHATGKSNASKDEMVFSALEKYPELSPEIDDNAGDAVWLLDWAEKQHFDGAR